MLSLFQKFDSRKCVVKKEEMKYWERLSLAYMTEESDDESDPNSIIEHKLTWRSKGENYNSKMATFEQYSYFLSQILKNFFHGLMTGIRRKFLEKVEPWQRKCVKKVYLQALLPQLMHHHGLFNLTW